MSAENVAAWRKLAEECDNPSAIGRALFKACNEIERLASAAEEATKIERERCQKAVCPNGCGRGVPLSEDVSAYDGLAHYHVNAEPCFAAAIRSGPPAGTKCATCGGEGKVWKCPENCGRPRVPSVEADYALVWCKCGGGRIVCPACSPKEDRPA